MNAPMAGSASARPQDDSAGQLAFFQKLQLKMDGIEKVFAGLTDMKMVRAVRIR